VLPWPIELEVGIGHGGIVADVGGDDGTGRHGLGEFPEKATGVHQLGGRIGPALQFVSPYFFLFLDVGNAFGDRLQVWLEVLDEGEQFSGELFGVCHARHIDLLAEAEDLGIDVHLDDLGVGRPIFNIILGQGAERPETAAEGQDHISFGNDAHRGFGTAVADGTDRQLMIVGEGVIVEVTVDDGRGQIFCQSLGFLLGVSLRYPAAGQDDRVLGVGEQLGGFLEGGPRAGAARDIKSLVDLVFTDPVEIVTGNIQLGRAVFRFRHVKGTAGQFGHPFGAVHPHLIDGLFLEHGHLIQLLKTTGADSHGAGLGGDGHHRRVGPEGGCQRRHKVGGPGAVLGDAALRLPGHTGQPVRRMAGRLFVGNRHEANAGIGEEVEGVHEG